MTSPDDTITPVEAYAALVNIHERRSEETGCYSISAEEIIEEVKSMRAAALPAGSPADRREP